LNTWGALTVVLMIAATVISFVPMIPGPALVWAVGLIYAAATEFTEVGLGTVLWMTVLMLIGSTADWWTRLFGLGAEGKLSCWTFVISTAGAIIGTVVIPIPLVGTLLGAAAGVAAWVFWQEEDWHTALKAARGILSAWIASFFVEFVISIAIAAFFIRALLRAWGLL
jgi:uncharacterized protein